MSATHTHIDKERARGRRRRENDEEARTDLYNATDSEYHDAIADMDLKDTSSAAKAMKAATMHIKALAEENQQLKKDVLEAQMATREAIEATNTCSPLRALPSRPTIQHPPSSAITTGIPAAWTNDIPELRQLRQATTRLRQMADQKVEAENGLEGELEDLLKGVNNMLVDFTDAMQQGNMTREQKEKWARAQKQLGRVFWLEDESSDRERMNK